MNIIKAEEEIRRVGNGNISPVLEALCLTAMETVLNKFGFEVKETPPVTPPVTPPIQGAICPDCGEPLNNQEGCQKCLNCGWSKCA